MSFENVQSQTPVGTTDEAAAASSPVLPPSALQSAPGNAAADPVLVAEVRDYMTVHRLSQPTVGTEARISQAVISQWLSHKYRGHNDKVDAVMRQWLAARKAAGDSGVAARPDDSASVLRPSRALTVAEKLERAQMVSTKPLADDCSRWDISSHRWRLCCRACRRGCTGRGRLSTARRR